MQRAVVWIGLGIGVGLVLSRFGNPLPEPMAEAAAPERQPLLYFPAVQE